GHIVDAPVSGGAARAAQGDLLVMVGGAQTDVETIRPVLDALASHAPVVGTRPGDGQRFKIVNQLLCGVHIAADGEALALADSMCLDLKQVHAVLGTGAAASFMFGDRGQRMVDGDFDDVRSALTIFVKDMGLVSEAAAEVSQEVPLAASPSRSTSAAASWAGTAATTPSSTRCCAARPTDGRDQRCRTLLCAGDPYTALHRTKAGHRQSFPPKRPYTGSGPQLDGTVSDNPNSRIWTH